MHSYALGSVERFTISGIINFSLLLFRSLLLYVIAICNWNPVSAMSDGMEEVKTRTSIGLV